MVTVDGRLYHRPIDTEPVEVNKKQVIDQVQDWLEKDDSSKRGMAKVLLGIAAVYFIGQFFRYLLN